MKSTKGIVTKVAWTADDEVVEIKIESHPNVWTPSLYARKFGDHLIAQRLFVKGRTVLDLGCGSGVLAILASKLGARRSVGLDISPKAISLTMENARLNGVAVEAYVSDGLNQVLEGELSGMRFDVVVCNAFSIPGEFFGADNGPDGRHLLDVALTVAPYIMKRGGKIIVCSNAEQGREITHHLLNKHWYQYEVLEADVFEMESPMFTEELKRRWQSAGRIWEEGGRYFHTAEFILARK